MTSDRIIRGPVASLIEYDRQMDRLVGRLKVDSKRYFMKEEHNVAELKILMDELTRGLQITALRARHRALTLKALIALREQKETGGRSDNAEALLQEAAKVRREAQAIVHYQEEIYRYPVDLLARPRKSLTAYEFGISLSCKQSFLLVARRGTDQEQPFRCLLSEYMGLQTHYRYWQPVLNPECLLEIQI